MKLLNYIGIMTALALSSSVTFAHNTFCGFYLGASAGGSMTDVTQDQTANVSFIGATTVLNGPISLKADNSPKGTLFLGLGKDWDAFYLGVEGFVDFSRYRNRNAVELFTTTGSLNQLSTHSKLSNTQFGIDLRPGVLLTPQSMLYARVGASFADLTLDTNYTSFVLTEISTVALSEEKDVVGLRLGAGLEQLICPRLSVRFDYIYTYYGRISNGTTVASDISGVDVISTSNTNIKVYNNTVMFGLAYWFC